MKTPTHCDRILEILSDGKPHGHHEFYGFCVLHSRIAELRKRGHVIECWREGESYLYQLTSLCDARPAERLGPNGDLASQSESSDHEVRLSAEAPLASLDSCGRGATPGDAPFRRRATGTVLGDHSSSVGDQGLPPRRANERKRARSASDAPQQLSLEGIAA